MLHPDAFSYCSISISYKYVKQVVLINDSWISTTLQKEWELEFCLFFKKWRRIHFSPKKGEVGKTVEEWRLLRENNLCFLPSLSIYLSIIYIYVCIYIPIRKLLVYIRNRHLYHILPVVHIFSLTMMTYLKILIWIKSLNTKQCPARLSPPPVKLSSFIVGKFSPKKGESNLWLLLIFVFVNPTNFMI